MKLKVAFYKGKGRLRDRFIRRWTRSRYSHVELVLPNDGGWIGIYPPDSPRVRLCDPSRHNHREWDFIDFEITKEQFDSIVYFFDATESESYDWIGMVLSHVLPFKIRHINKWYCSEWVAYALSLSGVVDWSVLALYKTNKLPPGKLYNILRKESYNQSKVFYFDKYK